VSASASPLGRGLYFIDVLACLLFCLTLALVGARFSREVTVPVELPTLPERAQDVAGADLSGSTIVLRRAGQEVEVFYDGEPLSLEELAARLAAAPPPSVVVRSETSPLARVIGAAHAAGVHDIRLAYEEADSAEATCCD
jgi:biopolymer transport protein ExbD